MSSININKLSNLESVNNVRNSDVKRSGKEEIVSGENKISVNEDKIEISGKISDVGKYVDKIKELPDIRQDQVNSLKEKVLSGEYQPSSQQIADAILKSEGKV